MELGKSICLTLTAVLLLAACGGEDEVPFSAAWGGKGDLRDDREPLEASSAPVIASCDVRKRELSCMIPYELFNTKDQFVPFGSQLAAPLGLTIFSAPGIPTCYGEQLEPGRFTCKLKENHDYDLALLFTGQVGYREQLTPFQIVTAIGRESIGKTVNIELPLVEWEVVFLPIQQRPTNLYLQYELETSFIDPNVSQKWGFIDIDSVKVENPLPMTLGGERTKFLVHKTRTQLEVFRKLPEGGGLASCGMLKGPGYYTVDLNGNIEKGTLPFITH